MTAARHNRKARPATILAGIWLACAAVLPGATGLHAAATSERIVLDRHTGLAIHGFDPVAYFTDARPAIGREQLELSFAGVVWRFRNAGNRAAFAEHPDIYMPRFGGYDPVALGRGVATPGHPHLWLVADDRLYLFHSLEALSTFAADPEQVIAVAQARWADVRSTLVP
jgi:hypothetical protein